ncbi:MAG: ADP-ribosylglycohydrolase family protein [Lachnospiraceae bacterium]|nr:ADP-ribosylglycohydrolase family protein [Lachnospiraceae bacterium]
MYGSMLGDIIGSPYEFDYGGRKKDFFLFDPKCKFTDDSLLTVAVGDAMMQVKKTGTKDRVAILDTVTKTIRKWCNNEKYSRIHDEYGIQFGKWLRGKDDPNYKSMGNGSAMRVGSVGWLFDDLEETIRFAGYTSETTHRHPEGIKGAQAVAAVIYMARHGNSKDEIKQFITQRFGYNLNNTVANLQQTYCPSGHQSEICPTCIPEAIVCFLEADSYEDAVRNAVSIGGDTDTIACITGSMAEALYGVPSHLIRKCEEYIDKDMLAVARNFSKIRAGYKEFSMDEFNKDLFLGDGDPLKSLELYKKTGEIDYSYFTSRMDEQATFANTARAKEYAAMASKAVKLGYPLDDINAMFEIRTALNMAPGKDTPEVISAKEKCERVWNDMLSNEKDGKTVTISRAERVKKLKDMQTALLEYKNSIGYMNQTATYINDFALYELDKRLEAGLAPAEKARMSESIRDAYATLCSVDPSGMISSSEFREMKSSFKNFVELSEDPGTSPERYNDAKKELADLQEKYLKYKQKQNKGKKRSGIEYERVTVVEAILDRLRKDDFSVKEAPEDIKAKGLVSTAEKKLFEGKDVEKAAAITMAAKKLKEAGTALTYDNLKTKSRELMNDQTFKDTVAAYDSKEIEDAIWRGSFEKKTVEVVAKNDYMNRRSGIFSAWKRAHDQKSVAYKKAYGDYKKVSAEPKKALGVPKAKEPQNIPVIQIKDDGKINVLKNGNAKKATKTTKNTGKNAITNKNTKNIKKTGMGGKGK